MVNTIIVPKLERVPNLKVIRITPGMYGNNKGNSDILICYLGIFVAIEMKIENKKPTKLQEKFLQDIINAGGFSFICRTWGEVKWALNYVKSNAKIIHAFKNKDTYIDVIKYA